MEGVTIESIRDAVVSANTFKSYLGDLIALLQWIYENKRNWLTDHGKDQLCICSSLLPNETVAGQKQRVRETVTTILRNAFNEPILILDAVVPADYMSFILTLRKSDGSYLSSSSYGNKRSALYHLFRLHNRVGFTKNFTNELTNLFKGFNREIAQKRGGAVEGGEGGNVNHREGKEPMSVDLYKCLCGWFLKYGTIDGIFAHCFLVLTWNLSCRAVNTAKIMFPYIKWSQSFDSFCIHFSHTKTDQLGEEAKYARHLYANPITPIVCPVLALSMYLTCCFNSGQSSEGLLFPGQKQESRFSVMLQKVLEKNWPEVNTLGFHEGDIGTHSIRKGAVSYLASLPGGPPAASTCIRAGWTMGKVKDVYMRYVSSGDEFVGRCLSLLSLLRTDFGVSPPHFVTENLIWIEGVRMLQFPMIGLIDGLKKITRMCLASILFHRSWLCSYLSINHTFLITSYVHRNAEAVNYSQQVIITHPWTDNSKAFTGVPPQISLLYEVTTVRDRQQQMIGNFIDAMRELLVETGVDGGRMSENNLKKILADFQEQFMAGINGSRAETSIRQEVATAGWRSDTGISYLVHNYSGKLKRVPADWRFPRCGAFDLWRQWWIGDSVRNISPLRFVELPDLIHLDKIPLSDDELHGRRGQHKLARRPAKKTLSDMRKLMQIIQQKVEEGGFFCTEVTPESVDRMYRSVEDYFIKFTGKGRDSQKSWISVLGSIDYAEKKGQKRKR
jgi:hypothetical protein